MRVQVCSYQRQTLNIIAMTVSRQRTWTGEDCVSHHDVLGL